MFTQDQIEAYIYSFEKPAEVDFFDVKQKQTLDKESAKLKKTQEYFKAVSDNPGLGSKVDQDVATGVIYSQGEMNKVLQRNRALQGMGERVSPNQSIVSPTGQRIIMSDQLTDYMGFLTDGYVAEGEIDDLVESLKLDGVSDASITKVKDAMKKFGAIVMQRGAFEQLFDLLSEVAENDLTKMRPHGASLEALKAVAAPEIKPKTGDFAKELKKEVTTKELVGNDEKLLPKPSVPKPPILEPVAKPVIHSKPSQPARPSSLGSIHDAKSPDDLKRIQVANLRQGDLPDQVAQIMSKVIEISKSNKILPYHAVVAFEASPLFKTYLTIGTNLIADPNQDRSKAFELAVDEAGKSGQDNMTLDEFEAIADLRKEIEQL